MNIFENILINMIFIIFPLMFLLLYQTYNTTLNKKKNDLFLDCALFSSLYLIIRFGNVVIDYLPLVFFNIPLIIAYTKKRNISIILLSVFIILYYNYSFHFNIILLIIEHLLYYLISRLLENKKYSNENFINGFIVIKFISFIFMIILVYDFPMAYGYKVMDFLILMIAFYIFSHFTVYLFSMVEDILSLHVQIKQLQREKDITSSLFQITHEIKNPIAVCKGYLDMFDVENIDHSIRYVPILKEEINRVLILLEDFLSINKIKINKDIIDINVLLEDMIKSFYPILKSKNIIGNFSVDDDELYISADYNRLSQVLVNMIKNSMESIPDDHNGMISLYLKKGLGNIKIYIKDNGVGMDNETLEKIKQPFNTTKKQGNGLGVYLSNEIIQAHNGTIKYFSKENKGTKVVITLPWNKKDIKSFS